MIEQISISSDPAAKLAIITGTSWGIVTAKRCLLTESGMKMAVNERDEGQAIETGADVTDFVAIEAMRTQVEEGSYGGIGHIRGRPWTLMQTEQIEGEVG